MRPDRIEKDEEVLVDIISCEKEPDLHDIHLSGRTMDVSEAGMKVTMTVSVPEQTKLGLRLDMDQKVFRLEGQVRWSKSDGEVTVGVLLDKDSPDYQKWLEIFELDIDDEF